jgi:hypothetical protein
MSTEDELAALTAAFLRSVTFAPGERPDYEAIRKLFIDGDVAHRMSTYAKRGVRDGAAFAARGVISTQFVRTTDGWRMSSMAWDDERPGLPLPERYAA